MPFIFNEEWERNYRLSEYLQAGHIAEYKITPSIVPYQGKHIVLMHILYWNCEHPNNSFDIWPQEFAEWDDVINLPSIIDDLQFSIRYIPYRDRRNGENSLRESDPRWNSFSSEGNEVTFRGGRIPYDNERHYFGTLGSLPVYDTIGFKYLFFDTETTGLRHEVLEENGRLDWPRLVQLGWVVTDDLGKCLSKNCMTVRPNGFFIPDASTRIHGISNTKANNEGRDLSEVLNEFIKDARMAHVVVGHNLDYDIGVIESELKRLGRQDFSFDNIEQACTMKLSVLHCRIKRFDLQFKGFAYPKLSELYNYLFGNSFQNAHDALSDAEATMKCYWEMRRKGIIDHRNKVVPDLFDPVLDIQSDYLPF